VGKQIPIPIRGLYGMIDVTDVTEGGPPSGALAQALLDGGARVLQLRMKHGGAGAMLAVLAELRGVCGDRALLIVNDRLDVALAGGADGVHLGQDDLALADARRQVPPGFVIGISTHNEAQAAAAIADGADYLGFGPIFPTSSKDRPDPVVGVARLAAVCAASRVPVVAIGGITLAAVPSLVAAGAAAVAMISAIHQAPDPVAAAGQVSAAFGVR